MSEARRLLHSLRKPAGVFGRLRARRRKRHLRKSAALEFSHGLALDRLNNSTRMSVPPRRLRRLPPLHATWCLVAEQGRTSARIDAFRVAVSRCVAPCATLRWPPLSLPSRRSRRRVSVGMVSLICSRMARAQAASVLARKPACLDLAQARSCGEVSLFIHVRDEPQPQMGLVGVEG